MNHPPPGKLAVAVDASVLVAFIGLLLLPAPTLDPAGVGPRFSWPLACAGFAIVVGLSRVGRRFSRVRVAPVTVPAAPSGLAWTTPRWRPGPVEWLLGSYVAVVLVTWPSSYDRRVTAQWILVLATQLAVFCAARSLFETRWLRRLAVIGLAIGLFWLQWLALHDHLWAGAAERPKDYLLPAGWSGRPELGFLAAVLVGLTTGLWLEVRTRWERAAGVVIWLAALGQLAFLFARLGWIAGVVVLGLAAFAAARARRLAVYACVVGLLLVAVVPLSLRHPLVQPLIRSFAGERTLPDGAVPQFRFEIWERTLGLVRDHWATGTGLGNFRAVYEPNYNPQLNDDLRRGVHAHNTWLQQAGELGVAGGAIYALLWIGVLAAGWRRVSREEGEMERVPTTAAWLALVAAAAYLLGETLTFELADPRLRMQTLCWLLAAVVITPSERQQSPLES